MTDWLHQQNFAYSTLAAQLASDGLVLEVTEDEGALFPDDNVSDHWQLVIWGSAYSFPAMDSTREIVHAHYKAKDQFDITRAQEGTSAKQWEIGDKCALVLSAQYLADIEGKIDALAAADIAFTATDKLLGRSTVGAGAGEEIACTAAGRDLLDDANAAAQLTTIFGEFVGWTTPSFDANNFTGYGSMTVTVEAGDVTQYQYLILGKLMFMIIDIGAFTTGGSLDAYVQVKIPVSKSAVGNTYTVGAAINNGEPMVPCRAIASATNIRFTPNLTGSNWAAGTNNNYIRAIIFFPIS